MNPHTHTPESHERLRASIERHGVLVPIFVDSSGEIIDGHHRAEILESMGVPREEWPIVEWPDGSPDELRQHIAKLFRDMYNTLA